MYILPPQKVSLDLKDLFWITFIIHFFFTSQLTLKSRTSYPRYRRLTLKSRTLRSPPLSTINDFSGKIGQNIAEFGPKNVINRKVFVINKLSVLV